MSIDHTLPTLDDFAQLVDDGTTFADGIGDDVETSEAIPPGFSCPVAEFFRDADEGTGE
ncbi:MAG: hypothetical protein WD066_10330 [Planctomycetaceae bacterium]